METKPIEELAEVIASHQVYLTKIGSSWGNQINDYLSATEKKLTTEITSIVNSMGQNKLSADTLKKLRKMEDKVTEIRGKAIDKAKADILEEANLLVLNEGNFASNVTSAVSGDTEGISQLSAKKAKSIVNYGIFDGGTIDSWFTAYKSEDIARITSAVRAGVANGTTTRKIAQNIMGTAENDYNDGIVATSRKGAMNLARTISSGVADEAKVQFYKENSNIVKKIKHLATLDGRTCTQCGALDQREYSVDSDDIVTIPVHINCRCVHIPVAEDSSEGVRPSANADFNAEAKRLYNEKYPNKNYDDLSESTRKKYYYEAINNYKERTGNEPFKQVSGNMDFATWLEKSDDKMLNDFLGETRFELYKNGNLKIKDLLGNYDGEKMSIKQLAEFDRKAFEKTLKTTTNERVKSTLEKALNKKS